MAIETRRQKRKEAEAQQQENQMGEDQEDYEDEILEYDEEEDEAANIDPDDEEFEPEEGDEDLDDFIVHDDNNPNRQQQIVSEAPKRYNTRRSSNIARNSDDTAPADSSSRRPQREIQVIDDIPNNDGNKKKRRRNTQQLQTQQLNGVLLSSRTHANRQRAEQLQHELSEIARKRIEELQQEQAASTIDSTTTLVSDTTDTLVTTSSTPTTVTVSSTKDESSDEEDEGDSDVEDDYVDVTVPAAARYIATEDGKDVELPHGLASILKPHQLDGVRFCWRTVVMPEEKSKGCILAHSMGLGKTLQMVSFVYLFLIKKKGRRVLILTPKSTLINWRQEFEQKWLKYYGRGVQIPTYMIDDDMRTRKARWQEIETWSKNGGVLLLGYEMFRILVSEEQPFETNEAPIDPDDPYAPFLPTPKRSTKRARKPKSRDWHMYKEKFQQALLVNTELVICDEGHRIKNPETQLSKAIVQIKTRNRIVLTGTPLQNHLMEYFWMIDWVRPNYWTKDEFNEFFAKPIQAGFHTDASQACVSCMKRRAYVLVNQVKPFIDRRDQRILRDSLPEKQEFVILFKINEFQELLYKTFLEANKDKRGPFVLLYMSAILSKIVNHPDLLYMYAQRNGITLESLFETPDAARINLEQDLEETSVKEEEEPKKNLKTKRRQTRSNPSMKMEVDDDILEQNLLASITTNTRVKVEVKQEVKPEPASNSIIEIEDDDLLELDLFKAVSKPTVKTEVKVESPRTNPDSNVNNSKNQPIQDDDDVIEVIEPTPRNRRRPKEVAKSNPSSNKKRRRESVPEEDEPDILGDDTVDDELLDMYAEDERIMTKEVEKQKRLLAWHWLLPVLQKEYVRDLITRSPKMEFLIRIIEKCYMTNEKLLVFSMYTETLTLIENVLNTRCKFPVSSDEKRPLLKNVDYFRLDGSTPVGARQSMIDEFNSPECDKKIFLISIRAGSLGINLTAASRVVLFDVPWVPAVAQQAIFRAYRYGQTKPVFIYRFVAAGTMEQKIFNRCVLKTWLFKRVVDNDAPRRILEAEDLNLFNYNLEEFKETNLINSEIYKDDIMLAAALGLGHVPDGTHRLAPVDITQPEMSQSNGSGDSTTNFVGLSADRNRLEQTSAAIERRLQEEEHKIGELDVKRKIAAVYHHESLYIDDLEEHISSHEKELGEAEYNERKARYAARDEIMQRMEQSVNIRTQTQTSTGPGVAQPGLPFGQSIPGYPGMSMPMPMPQPTIPVPVPQTSTGPAADYSDVARSLPCNCIHCHQLKNFVLDTSKTELRMRISKNQRKHIHRMLNASSGISHMSEGVGRSRTLVLRKVRQPGYSAQRVPQLSDLDALIRNCLASLFVPPQLPNSRQ